MKISGIYKIQSIVKPDRIYIGSAIDITVRWKNHLKLLRRNKHHSVKLQNHYNKYGEFDLQFLILLGCEKEDLVKIEQYFLDSYKHYFNICSKAYSSLGIKHPNRKKLSIENRKKMSEVRMGKIPWNKGKKGLQVAWNRGRSFPEETRNKMSESGKKRKPMSIETKLKMGIAKRGTKDSEEIKQHKRDAWAIRKLKIS